MNKNCRTKFAATFCRYTCGVIFWERRGNMKVINRINTNAALAIDGSGKEVVILGKGVGFPQVPYELTDLSKIQRTFYEVDSKYINLIESIPETVLLASADIAERAEDDLDCTLNPNLPFTLADHLAFAMERVASGVELTTPLAYDVNHLYPQEARVGVIALDILFERTGVRLPGAEAVNVALHIINAEIEQGDMHNMALTLKVISDVSGIIEDKLSIHLDAESFHYSRFTMHLRYLIQRLVTGKEGETGGGMMLKTLALEYPDVYLCAKAVSEYFETKWGWSCSKEEVMYLMLHIGRLREKSESR